MILSKIKQIMIKIIKNPIILIDGSFYFYRAYYAYPSLSNSLGEPTGAIYGMLKMLRNLLVQYESTHIGIIFDSKEKTFRHYLFDKYKSNRPIMPDDLRLQIKPLYNMLKTIGLPFFMVPKVEADDVIGTLALESDRANRSVLISTGDKDMAQLVTRNIAIYDTIQNIVLGPKEIHHKYGVPPELIIDYLALMGDASDNVPGVPGIGKKTAKILLQNFFGLNALYNNLDKISKLKFYGSRSISEKLYQHKEIAYLSLKLVKIKTNVKLNFSYADLIVFKSDINQLKKMFIKYEFNNLLQDFFIKYLAYS